MGKRENLKDVLIREMRLLDDVFSYSHLLVDFDKVHDAPLPPRQLDHINKVVKDLNKCMPTRA